MGGGGLLGTVVLYGRPTESGGDGGGVVCACGTTGVVRGLTGGTEVGTGRGKVVGETSV